MTEVCTLVVLLTYLLKTTLIGGGLHSCSAFNIFIKTTLNGGGLHSCSASNMFIQNNPEWRRLALL